MSARVERAAAARVARAVAGLAEALRDDLPRDVRVEVDGDRLALVGRRLRARSLTDARLRSARR